jgi:hypothetical protein
MSGPDVDRAVARPAGGAILAVLCLAQLMLGIDVTIVQIANPAIQKELGFSTLDLQWTVTPMRSPSGGSFSWEEGWAICSGRAGCSWQV